jgi:hypothetical protein
MGGLTACAGMPAAARPPAIGFLASEFGLRVGLTTLAFLALAAGVIARISDSGHVAAADEQAETTGDSLPVPGPARPGGPA